MPEIEKSLEIAPLIAPAISPLAACPKAGAQKSEALPAELPPTSNQPLAVSHPDPTPSTIDKRRDGGGSGVWVVVGGSKEKIQRREVKDSEKEGWKNNNRKNGNLRNKDKEILRLLETWGALGVGQLTAASSQDVENPAGLIPLFFNEPVRYVGAVYLRLWRLQGRGLVHPNRALNTRQLYSLTRKGHAALRREGAARFSHFLESVTPKAIEHRVNCSGAGRMIRRFLGVPVWSEREAYDDIRSNFGGRRPVGFHVPDLVIESKDGRCPVEVELTQKGDAEYRRLWESYKDSLKGSPLYYLVPTQLRMRNLLELAGDCKAPFLYAADLTSFKESLAGGAFVNFLGQERFIE